MTRSQSLRDWRRFRGHFSDSKGGEEKEKRGRQGEVVWKKGTVH